jgi:hypothetical protein
MAKEPAWSTVRASPICPFAHLLLILGAMKTEFFESDPFAPRKADLLLSLDTDYRFEKGDEVIIETGNRTTKVRVMDVRIHVKAGVISREILSLKL